MGKPESMIDQLDKQNVAQVAPAVQPGIATPGMPPALGQTDLLSQLLQLMLLKEGREIAAQQQKIDADKVRQAQRHRNAKEQDTKVLLRQARCKHLKGGKKGPKNQQRDFALSQHTFINAETVIRCRVCGMRWRKGDTAEYLLRNGRKVSNHTHIGWREAVGMMDQSSDTPTTSEILIDTVRPGSDLLGSQSDAAGLPYTPQITDLDGKIVENVEL